MRADRPELRFNEQLGRPKQGRQWCKHQRYVCGLGFDRAVDGYAHGYAHGYADVDADAYA
jgi:hypothetical protein